MQGTAVSDAQAHHRGITDREAAAPLVSAPERFSPFVQSAGGVHTLTMAVTGIHCARCIWAIESALKEEPDVDQARVNMSTGRLVVSWRGAPSRADVFAQKVEALGYRLTPIEQQQHSRRSEEQDLIRRMAVAGFAMGNLMLLSVALWSSNQQIMGLATRELFHFVSGAIAIPAILYAGRPFFSSAISVLRQGRTNMDVPISLALVLACGMSISETLHHGEHAYFDSAVMLMFFLLVGRWLDSRARQRARQNAQDLLAMLHGTASVVQPDGSIQTLAIKDLREGMQVQVAAGEKIPTDATVQEGISEVDTSLITGETLPVAVQSGSIVHGGTINLTAPLVCRINKASDDSLLAEIIRLMEQSEQGRARYVRLADRAARLYTPVVHLLALAAFAGWYWGAHAGWQQSLLVAITTLIITCPCALGLAVPVVQVLASSWLMRRGILLKSGDALERLASVDTICFDKTGTLTLGKPALHEPLLPHRHDHALAAALAAHSRHPLAIALRDAWQAGALPSLSDVQEVPGSGMSARYEGQTIMLGRALWCCPEMVRHDQDDTQNPVQELWCVISGHPPQRFTFTDALRGDAAETVSALQHVGMRVHMLSGDRQIIAQHVATQTGISHVHAPCRPAEKTQCIMQLKAQGAHVLMVGDGLNDAPALSAASVSMSPSTGVDIAQNSADIVFQGKNLAAVWQSWMAACLSTRLVKQNFALAMLYNVCAVPLAIAGYVTPMVAAIAMSSSSLIVILNSFRMNRLKAAMDNKK